MIISALFGSKQVSPHAQPCCNVSTAVSECEFKFSQGCLGLVRQIIDKADKEGVNSLDIGLK